MRDNLNGYIMTPNPEASRLQQPKVTADAPPTSRCRQASERSLPRLSRDCCFSVAASGSVLKLMQFYL